jgi:cytochrome oxidase Cu insertion factor (SCO1/SenC/PrrC family)
MKKISLITLFLSVFVILSGCAPQASSGALEIGSIAPDFTLDDALGGQTSLSDYHGTPVLLFFHMAAG